MFAGAQINGNYRKKTKQNNQIKWNYRSFQVIFRNKQVKHSNVQKLYRLRCPIHRHPCPFVFVTIPVFHAQMLVYVPSLIRAIHLAMPMLVDVLLPKVGLFTFLFLFQSLFVCKSPFYFSHQTKKEKKQTFSIIKSNYPLHYHCFPQRYVMYKFFQFSLHTPIPKLNAAQFICTHQCHISWRRLRFPLNLFIYHHINSYKF